MQWKWSYSYLTNDIVGITSLSGSWSPLIGLLIETIFMTFCYYRSLEHDYMICIVLTFYTIDTWTVECECLSKCAHYINCRKQIRLCVSVYLKCCYGRCCAAFSTLFLSTEEFVCAHQSSYLLINCPQLDSHPPRFTFKVGLGALMEEYSCNESNPTFFWSASHSWLLIWSKKKYSPGSWHVLVASVARSVLAQTLQILPTLAMHCAPYSFYCGSSR